MITDFVKLTYGNGEIKFIGHAINYQDDYCYSSNLQRVYKKDASQRFNDEIDAFNEKGIKNCEAAIINYLNDRIWQERNYGTEIKVIQKIEDEIPRYKVKENNPVRTTMREILAIIGGEILI